MKFSSFIKTSNSSVDITGATHEFSLSRIVRKVRRDKEAYGQCENVVVGSGGAGGVEITLGSLAL